MVMSQQPKAKKSSSFLNPTLQSSTKHHHMNTRYRPFTMSRAVYSGAAQPEIPSGGGETGQETRPKLCKRCESLALGWNSDTIHSTLAYSRCRCHRLFKYRTKKETSVEEDAKADDSSTRNGPLKREHSVSIRGSNKAKRVAVTTDHAGTDKATLDRESKPSILPALPTLPSTTSLTVLPCLDSSHVTQNELTSPRKGRFISPTHISESSDSTKFPPIISCVQQSVTNCLVSRSKQFMTKQPTDRLITELVGIVKLIDESKRRHLKELFREIDKNGDGHITCSEFISSCPACSSSSTLLLKQFYAALSEATYFGLREFMLCYSIAERLSTFKNVVSFSDVNAEFLETALCPFIKSLASFSDSDGMVTQQNFKTCVTHFNEANSDIVISIRHLSQVFMEGEANIIDCLALAPFILFIT